MVDPSQVLSQILTNITSKAQPSRPQLPSLFDYFVKSRSGDLIQPAAIKKWTEKHSNTPMTSMDNESPSMNEEFYFIPSAFFNNTAIEVFESLSDAERLVIHQANEKAYNDAVVEYQNKMKKLYTVKEGVGHQENEALEMVACALQPVMAALEALTDLHMIGWAGGSTANGIGIIKVSGQCGDPTESPMIFPRSQTDILRYAAQKWITKVGDEAIEQWVGSPYTSTAQSITQVVTKRKSPGDDIRLIKRTKTLNPTNTAARDSSSLSPQSKPGMTRSSISTALGASSLEGQTIGSEDFVVRQLPMPGSRVFPRLNKVPQRAVLAPRMMGGHQTRSSNVYIRHRSESLPPIRTLNQDDGLAPYRSQSTSEGLTMSIKKQRTRGARVTVDEEYRKSFSPLFATIPSSARTLLSGLESITKVDLGFSYQDIVKLLITIETLYGFKTNKKKGIPHSLRPREVTTWIASGRGRAGGQVTVVNVDQFSEAWWKWWMNMQPKWRGVDASSKPKQTTPIRAEDEDWKCLEKPGANGMISVVAGLYGWGVAIKRETMPLGSGEKRADWLSAVEDCRWVMERLIGSLKNEQEEERSEGHRSEEDELDIETADDDVDYMQGDTAYRP